MEVVTEALLIILTVLVLAAVIVWIRTARRLDRLHRSVIQYRTTLADALATRSALSKELSQTGVLDVAASVLLAEAAMDAVAASSQPVVEDGLEGPAREMGDDRCAIESRLSRTLRAVTNDVEVDETSEYYGLWTDLCQSRRNVRLARRFHNTRVDQTRRVREKNWVRFARMAGTAAMPAPVDLDDE